MATCSDGDSFYLDAFHRWGSLGSLDGCYSDSGYTENFLPEYFRSGAKVEDEPVVLASSDFGSQVKRKLCVRESPLPVATQPL